MDGGREPAGMAIIRVDRRCVSWLRLNSRLPAAAPMIPAQVKNGLPGFSGAAAVTGLAGTVLAFLRVSFTGSFLFFGVFGMSGSVY
jgi:hypothetical protein